LAVPTVIFLSLFLRASDERDLALAEVDRLNAIAAQQVNSATAQRSEMRMQLARDRSQAQDRFIDAIQWAVNEGARVGFDEVAFNTSRIDQLSELLTHLASLGFRGTVRLESHLGEFCLVTDETGTYRPADPGLPLNACTLIGHPLDGSSFVADRQTVDFANFLAGSPLVNQAGITVEIIAHDRTDSVARYPYPNDTVSAGEWNRVAGLNHRVEFSVVPADS
jgi:hypothetical protein